METKIDKNVPIPPKGRVNKQNSKHKHLNKIIESWEVGDSVALEFVAKTTGKDKRSSYSLEATAVTAGEHLVGGHGVWGALQEKRGVDGGQLSFAEANGGGACAYLSRLQLALASLGRSEGSQVS